MTSKLSAKEIYKRLKFKEQIQKKVAAAEANIKKAYTKRDAIQESCPHYDSEYRNRGSNGNWDRDEHYWRVYECNDCGKKWNTDQSYEQDKNYPYAIDKTYK